MTRSRLGILRPVKAAMYLLAIGMAGCGSIARPAPAAPLPIVEFDGQSVVQLGERSAPSLITLVGPQRQCRPTERTPVRGGVAIQAPCAARVALDGPAPDATLVPLTFEPMRGGPGRVGSGHGWTVRLAYGPLERGCPGLPVHVQVKLGRRAILRQNVWFRVTEVDLLTTGERTWLVLSGSGRAQTIPLAHDGEGQVFDTSSSEGSESECDAVESD